MRGAVNNCTFLDQRAIFAGSAWKHTPQSTSTWLTNVPPTYQKDVRGHTGCVNSVEFDPAEALLASGGDDMKVVVWRVTDLLASRTPKPLATMEAEHESNIFAHEFSYDSTFLYSGGNDKTVIKHDVATTKMVQKFSDDISSVYHICASPMNNNIVSAACEREVVILDTRSDVPDVSNVTAAIPRGSYYAGQFNPAHGSLLLVAAAARGLLIFDLRNYSKPLMDENYFTRPTRPDGDSACAVIFSRWNTTGTGIAALFSYDYPHYYDLVEHRRVQFKDSQYYNYHTIKSLDIINDEVIITGSDKFDIFSWRIPKYDESSAGSIRAVPGIMKVETVEKADCVLKGHRSIVNHVKYSAQNDMLVSSGVEKMVKCWSKYAIPGSYATPFVRRVGDFTTPRAPLLETSTAEAASSSGDGGDDVDADDDGLARFADVFGGNCQTSEDRAMLAYFDELILSSDDDLRDMVVDDDSLSGIIERDLIRRRIEFLQHFADIVGSASGSEDGLDDGDDDAFRISAGDLNNDDVESGDSNSYTNGPQQLLDMLIEDDYDESEDEDVRRAAVGRLEPWMEDGTGSVSDEAVDRLDDINNDDVETDDSNSYTTAPQQLLDILLEDDYDEDVVMDKAVPAQQEDDVGSSTSEGAVERNDDGDDHDDAASADVEVAQN